MCYFHPENWGNDPNFMNVFFKWVSSTTTLLMGRPCLTFISIWRSDTIWTLINLQAGCPNPSLRTSWGIAKVKGKILLLGAWKKWSESLSCRWRNQISLWTVQLKRITFITSTFYVTSILDYSWDEPSDFFGQATGASSVWPADGWCLRNPVGLSKRSPCQQNQKFRRRRGSKRNAAGGLVESGIGLRRQISRRCRSATQCIAESPSAKWRRHIKMALRWLTGMKNLSCTTLLV